jgi:hypothetical protein
LIACVGSEGVEAWLHKLLHSSIASLARLFEPREDGIRVAQSGVNDGEVDIGYVALLRHGMQVVEEEMRLRGGARQSVHISQRTAKDGCSGQVPTALQASYRFVVAR